MLHNQTTGALPQKRLYLRSGLTMADVNDVRKELDEACRMLLTVADDTNCYALQMAGASINAAIEDVLNQITDSDQEGGEA